MEMKEKVLRHIDKCQSNRDDLHRVRGILMDFYTNRNKFKDVEKIDFTTYTFRLELKVYTFEDLHELRKVLRIIYGSWIDEIEEIEDHNGRDTVKVAYRYKGTKEKLKYLRLYVICLDHELPDSITKDGQCRMEVVNEGFTTRRFVCGV